jgi:hypothetical protein
MLRGRLRTSALALLAGPKPPPATVLIVPVTASTRRIRWLSVSAMSTSPSARTATPAGLRRWAAVAAPPSPEKLEVPVPATVEMMPVADTLRMRSLPVSAMRNPPSAVGVTARGSLSAALVAAAPSPAYELAPDPATVVMEPSSTRRMRWFFVSAMRKPPPGSAATPLGSWSAAAVADFLRRTKVLEPVPATVEMAPEGATARMRWLTVSAMRKPPSAVAVTSDGPFSPTRVASGPVPVELAHAGAGDRRDRARPGGEGGGREPPGHGQGGAGGNGCSGTAHGLPVGGRVWTLARRWTN